jgi:hypothetical protein
MTPAYTEHAGPDEPNFIDMSRIGFVVTQTRVLKGATLLQRDTPARKLIAMSRRVPGLSVEDFHLEWWAAIGELVKAFPHSFRAAASVADPRMYEIEVPVFDGFVELWWHDDSDFNRDWDASAVELIRTQNDLLDGSFTRAAVHDELRVIWPPQQ